MVLGFGVGWGRGEFGGWRGGERARACILGLLPWPFGEHHLWAADFNLGLSGAVLGAF